MASDFIRILISIFLIIFILSAIIYTLQVIGEWKMFKKAGKPGWPALIPIYNDYILCKITGVNPWWILIVIAIGPACNIIPGVGSLLSLVISIYFCIILNVSIARSFGKEDGWAVGLILLKPFFMFALGIGNSEYQGEKPMNDVIFETLGINNNKTQTKEANIQTEPVNAQLGKICPSCGIQVGEESKFCPNCGKEL